MDEDWTASHFSPSKARQQRAQAKDWEYVQSWLEKKFAPKPIPSFERNDETLKALLELASFNDAADEERALISDVHESALKELQEQVKNSKEDGDLTQTLAGTLTDNDNQSLTILARLSIALNASDVQPETLGNRTLDLIDTEFSINQQCRRANANVAYLEAELDRLSKIRNDLQSDRFSALPDLGQKTNDWIRGSKQLKIKVMEYSDRLNSLLDATPGSLAIADVAHMETDLVDIKNRLRSLEHEVRSFEGLPHDKDLARLKVAEASQELQELRRKRDHQFEGLVER